MQQRLWPDKRKDIVSKIVLTLLVGALAATGILITFYAKGQIQAIVVETITNDKGRSSKLEDKIAEIAVKRASEPFLSEANNIFQELKDLKSQADALVTEGKIFERAKSVVPIGSVITYAGGVDSSNGFITEDKIISKKDGMTGAVWLVCNGAELKVIEFGELSRAIGDTYGGKHDPATGKLSVFNLPNYGGMFLRGIDLSNTVDPNRNLSKEPQQSNVGPHKHKYENIDVSAHATGGYTRFDSYKNDPDDVIAKKILNKETVSDTDVSAGYIGKETRPINMAVHFIIRAK
jgi:microcystin-dependent protein